MGEFSIVNPLHCNPQFIIQRTAANGIGAADLFSINFDFETDALPLVKAELFLQLLWDRKCNRHTIGSLLADILDCESSEMTCHNVWVDPLQGRFRGASIPRSGTGPYFLPGLPLWCSYGNVARIQSHL